MTREAVGYFIIKSFLCLEELPQILPQYSIYCSWPTWFSFTLHTCCVILNNILWVHPLGIRLQYLYHFSVFNHLTVYSFCSLSRSANIHTPLSLHQFSWSHVAFREVFSTIQTFRLLHLIPLQHHTAIYYYKQEYRVFQVHVFLIFTTIFKVFMMFPSSSVAFLSRFAVCPVSPPVFDSILETC